MAFYPFLAQGRTAEGYSYAIAALYERGQDPTAFSEFVFGSYTDGLAIDVRLSQLLNRFYSDAAAAGASIHVPCAFEACGGIAGDPKIASQSAADETFCLSSGLRGFALPGLLSVIGDYSAEELASLFYLVKKQFADTLVTLPKLQVLLEMMKKGQHTAILISDGSGGQQGCAAILSPYEESHIFLEEC